MKYFLNSVTNNIIHIWKRLLLLSLFLKKSIVYSDKKHLKILPFFDIPRVVQKKKNENQKK